MDSQDMKEKGEKEIFFYIWELEMCSTDQSTDVFFLLLLLLWCIFGWQELSTRIVLCRPAICQQGSSSLEPQYMLMCGDGYSPGEWPLGEVLDSDEGAFAAAAVAA